MKNTGLIALFVSVLFAGGGIALATHSNPNELHACYKNNNGQMRYVSDPSTCLNSETALSWNQAGAPGLQGPAGPQGPAGGLNNVTVVFEDSVVADQTFASVTAECPAGTFATGGGWAMQGTVGVGANLDNFLVLANSPTNGTGWQANIRRSGPDNGRSWGVRVFANCAS